MLLVLKCAKISINMNLFKREKNTKTNPNDHSALAEVALNSIHDGVVITDKTGVIRYINPAAAQMINTGVNRAVGLDYGLVIKLESKEGRELSDQENPLAQSMATGQPLEPTQLSLIVDQSEQRLPISLSVQLSNDANASRIITFRDITKELAEEGEQTEFISTASHEMRTPVATIDGYLSLCLNPQTATIDQRAQGYLTAAQKASKHLGKLFQDLLDVTKLDDGHIKAHFVPVEMVSLIQGISDDYAVQAKDAKLNYSFGSNDQSTFGSNNRRMNQVVYGFIDVDFMREIMGNLISNAIKYTPAGGSIYVNVRGDGDRVLINVTDTGIGISAEDLGHIFQKFYRVDNSDTRTIGGTGLGLHIVKQRVEAMGGKVWAESAFGEGSTFYVSLPRITNDEYEKRMIAVRNQQMMSQSSPDSAQTPNTVPNPALASLPTPTPTPALAPNAIPGSIISSTTPAESMAPSSSITQPVQPTQPAQPTQPVQPAQPTQPAPITQPAPVAPALQPAPATQPAPVAPQLNPTPQAPQPAPAPLIAPSTPQQPVTTPQSVSVDLRPQPTSVPPTPIPPPTPTQNQTVQTINNNKLNGESK